MWAQPRIAFAVFLAGRPKSSRFAEAKDSLPSRNDVEQLISILESYEDLLSSPPLVQRLEDGSSIWPQMCP
jgi:hypothetical protein